MADFFADPGAWFDQAGNDIAKFFDGDKAVESDNAAESDNADKIADVISPLLEGGEGDDDLYGGTGMDFLFGWGGNDILDGQQGNDLLMGGPGNDSLTGGSGADIFQLSQGLDVITDFKLSENDCIEVGALWVFDLGQINIQEYDIGGIGKTTLLTNFFGDSVIVHGAPGIDVYNSIEMDYEGQCKLVAENFEVLA